MSAKIGGLDTTNILSFYIKYRIKGNQVKQREEKLKKNMREGQWQWHPDAVLQ